MTHGLHSGKETRRINMKNERQAKPEHRDDEQDAYRKTDQAEPAQMLSGQNPGQHKQNRQRAAQYQTGSGKQTEKDSLTPPAVVFGRQYIGRLAEKRELQHGFQSRQRAIAPFWGVKGPVTKKALFAIQTSKKKKQRPETDAVMRYYTLYINSQYIDRYINI